MSNSELPLSGTTQIVGIFGWPVSHSFSPRMHNAAFRELGLDWAYVPFPTPPEKLGDAIRGFRAAETTHRAVITIPHKEKVIEFLDGLSPLSEKMGTVNTLYWEGDRLMGTTTDPWGCLENLRRAGFQPQNQDIALIGCGGAARAISFAFACEHPEMPITVVFRREDGDQAQRLQRELLGKTQAAVSLFPLEEFENRAGNFELVVNATPVGMHPNEGAVPFRSTSSTTPAARSSWPRRSATAARPSRGWACCSTRGRSPSSSGPASRRRSTRWPGRSTWGDHAQADAQHLLHRIHGRGQERRGPGTGPPHRAVCRGYRRSDRIACGLPHRGHFLLTAI